MTDLSKQKELFQSIKQIIETTKSQVGTAVNAAMTLMYWNIGQTINQEILKNERADYGKAVIADLSVQLTESYGKGYSQSALTRMCKFHNFFQDGRIVATLSQQLSWSHFIEIMPIQHELERTFYTQMCRVERWSVRTLRKKIKSMLFQRMAISQKPEELAKQELQALRESDTVTPDLVFQNPYILDFLGLKDTFSERDFEQAILNEIEIFLLELGRGFAFVERQKRMIIDGKDYKLDLLFYHRKLKRLIAIDLKIGKFEASYKGPFD